MKRDMDLVRKLLIAIEEERPRLDDLPGYTEEQVLRHVELLIEHGLVVGSIVPKGDGTPAGASVDRLTWEGHDFLAAMRAPKLWAKVKEIAGRTGVALTIESVKQIVPMAIKALLG